MGNCMSDSDIEDMYRELAECDELKETLNPYESIGPAPKAPDKKPFPWRYIGYVLLVALGCVSGYVFAVHGFEGILVMLVGGFIAVMGLAIASMVFGLALMAG